MMRSRILVALLLCGVAGGTYAQSVPQAQPSPAAQVASAGMGPAYLKNSAVPGDLGVIPAPPAPGSAAEARDLEGAKAAVALRGTPRWTQAVIDAEIFKPNATAVMSCAAGIEIGAQTTPKLDRLMRRTMADLGLSTSAVKRRYQRPRPFMSNNAPLCTPEWETMLRKDGSYPSGHSAIGYGWGLILAELLPDRAPQLVARGRTFGDSRRICNAHWLSDVEEGRVAATVVVARLNADPAFRADMDAVREELKSVTAVPHDCDREAAALATAP